MNYSVMTEREVEIELSTSASEGLKSFTAHDRLLDSGRNEPEKTYAKSSARVVLTQLTNLYTVAFFVMGIVTAMCDFTEGMWSWVIFFAVAVINMVSGFLRDNRDRKIASEFDEKRTEECKIIRDGKEMTTAPTLLVKGDIVVLKTGDFVPADLRVLCCDKLKADESIFVDRGVPREKQSERAEDGTDMTDSPNILYSGTIVADGEATAAVIATGKDTLLAKMQKAKSEKINMHDKFARSAKSEKALICAALLAATFVMCFVSVTSRTISNAMAMACTVALCLIPAPVSLVRRIAIGLYDKRMRNSSVQLPDEDFIYQMGMTQYVLFDKGGVVTNGEMELEDRAVSGRDKLEMAVICSDCEFENDILTGSDIDKATVTALMNDGIDVKKVLGQNERVMFMPFDEQRKIMATVVKNGGGYRIIVKGSVDVVPSLCSHIADGDSKMEMNGEALHKLENISSSMAEKGLKIRALAFRDFEALPDNIEDEIKELVFAGVLGYREVMVRKTRDAVRKLRSVFVKPVMVTGDHSVTGAALARQAGLIKSEDECVSFREIADCSDDELCRLAEKYKVFTNATSSDRERLVKALAKNDIVTAVSGEQMCEHGVAINSAVVLGSGEDCNVKVETNEMPVIAEAVCNAREMRGNLAYVSLLAISVGICEALVLLYTIITGGEVVSSLNMLICNLLIAFVPCMTVALFASVHSDVRDRKALGLRCALQGVVGAIAAIVSNSDIVLFALIFAILNALVMCVSFKNMEKGKLGAKGAAVCAVEFLVCVFAAKGDNVWQTAVFALLAAAINSFVTKIYVKGLKK